MLSPQVYETKVSPQVYETKESLPDLDQVTDVLHAVYLCLYDFNDRDGLKEA